ncbi:MAG: hypothetical protein R2814_10695 [Flavobacteriaceae bacterium]
MRSGRTKNILSGGNDMVLVTDAIGTVEWVDKSLLNTDNQGISSSVVSANESVSIAWKEEGILQLISVMRMMTQQMK